MRFKHKVTILIIGLTAAVSIVVAGIVINGEASRESTGTLNTSGKNDSLLYDARTYSEIEGVTVDEAMRELELQDEAGPLDIELSSKEADTFAGLWIKHDPEFKIVVQFTRDGEETINKYVKNNLNDVIEIRTVKTSLADLELAQKQVLSALSSLNIPADSEIDVAGNCVIFKVTDRTPVDTAMQEGKLSLPDCIEIITVEGLAQPT